MTTPPPAFYKQACEMLESATKAAYAAQYAAAAAWAAYNEGTMTYQEANAVQDQSDAAWDAHRKAGEDYHTAYYKWCDESPTTTQGEPHP
jgi:hypothetical protein